MPHYIGIDLGGTNVKIGIIDDRNNVLARHSCPTQAHTGVQGVIKVMADAAAATARQAGLGLEQIDAIGMAAPGPANIAQGVINSAPNLPGWVDVPIRDLMRKATGRPTVFENDANAAAFGELWFGAGQGTQVRHMLMLTLGTGVGSGVIVDGRIVHGATGMGGEGGHIIVQPDGRPCGCGQKGCLEAYSSATNTVARAVEAIKAGKASSLTAAMNGPEGVTAKDVFEAARAGDALALQVVDETARYLGLACVNFCRLLDSEMIVFAGGMAFAGEFLLEKIRQAFARYTWKAAADHVSIVNATLGNDAGFIGSAAVARQAHQEGRLP